MSVQPGRSNHAQALSSVGVGYQPLPAPRVLRAAERQGDVPPPLTRHMTAHRLSLELRDARRMIRQLEREVAALQVELARRPVPPPDEPDSYTFRGAAALAIGPLDLGGGWTLEPGRRRVVRGDTSQRLSNTECLLLALVVKADGDTVPWEDLIGACFGTTWPRQEAMHAIRVHFSRMREKLGRVGAPVAIANIPTLGYRLLKEPEF